MTQTILIQLIGEQTIPNILPVNIIRPEKVYNLCTNRTEKQGHRIGKWITDKYTKTIRPLLKKLPGGNTELYHSTRRFCEELISNNKDKHIILNLTGGTKLMSLAMYQVAANEENTTIIYVQTDNKQEDMLYTLKTAKNIETKGWKNDSVPPLSATDLLEVGEQTLEYSSIRDWHPCIAAAKAVQELADNFTTNIGKEKQNSKLLSRIRTAAMNNPKLKESFAAAGCRFTQNATNETINTSFLTGQWWEVLVADYLERTGQYTEVLCSVQTHISREGGLTDVDVLATDGVTLTCYSCKRNLEKPDSEINKHESRSRKLGGIKCVSGLAVYKGNVDSYAKLREFTQAAHMQCLIGPMVCPTISDTHNILISGRGCSVESFLG